MPVAMSSSHHRYALENATVRLTIDRETSTVRKVGNALLFQASDQNGVPVALAIDASSWQTIEKDHPRDAIGELEQLALTGSWEDFGPWRVWRVILI